MAVRDSLVEAVLGHLLIAGAGRVERFGMMAQAHAEDGSDGVAQAEAILDHRFARPGLLSEALTHRSAAHGLRSGSSVSNERLEFVGDRVLGLLVAEWLAERFPAEQEGELGRRLAHLASQPVLAAIAEEVGLASALTVAPGESRAGVRKRATVLADAVEAAIGALYLDGGLAAARRFVRAAWEGAMIGQTEPPKDAKTALQEWAQARGFNLPVYHVVGRDGPPHAPSFIIGVTVSGETATGMAGTKRAGEQLAADTLLRRLGIARPA